MKNVFFHQLSGFGDTEEDIEESASSASDFFATLLLTLNTLQLCTTSCVHEP